MSHRARENDVPPKSLILAPVPLRRTVAGVPARIVGRPEVASPVLEMNQQFQHEFNDGRGISGARD